MQFFKYLINRVFLPQTLSAAARRAGYVKDQMGIRNRYLREKHNWQSHLDNTRNFILESAQSFEKKGSVAILGSGWLYDVPIEELSQMFESVHLVDIVHPEPVKERMKKLPNVALHTCDLTGNAVHLAMQSATFDEFMSHLPESKTGIDFDAYDMVVSVNLLNQLDIILCDYLQKRFRVGESQLQHVRRLIQQQHVDYLPKGKSCLVTDYLEIETPVGGSESVQKQLLYCKLPETATFKEWNWVFDTNQRYSVKNNTTFKVKAVCF